MEPSYKVAKGSIYIFTESLRFVITTSSKWQGKTYIGFFIVDPDCEGYRRAPHHGRSSLLPPHSKNKNRLPQPIGFSEVYSSALYKGYAPYVYMRVSREEGLKCYSVPLLFGVEFTVIADAKLARGISSTTQSLRSG